jgi:hypothetical protein
LNGWVVPWFCWYWFCAALLLVLLGDALADALADDALGNALLVVLLGEALLVVGDIVVV